MYLHTKFRFSSFSHLSCVFYEILRLVGIMNTRWQLFKMMAFFPFTYLSSYTFMPNFMFLAYSEHTKQHDE